MGHPLKPKPWYWGTTVFEVRKACKQSNSDLGLTEKQVQEIIASSIKKQEQSEIVCSLCNTPITFSKSHNPWPLGKEEDRCCSDCNTCRVVPARILMLDASKYPSLKEWKKNSPAYDVALENDCLKEIAEQRRWEVE